MITQLTALMTVLMALKNLYMDFGLISNWWKMKAVLWDKHVKELQMILEKVNFKNEFCPKSIISHPEPNDGPQCYCWLVVLLDQ